MPSNSTVIDVTYNDPRTGERVRERRVQRLPYDEFEDVRQKELAIFRRPSPVREQQLIRRERSRDSRDSRNSRDTRDEPNEDQDVEIYRRRVQRYTDDDYLAPSRPRRSEDYGRPRPRRRDPSPSSSDSESSRERRRRRRHRRARSELPNEQKSKQQQEDEGICWYSGKSRSDANFFERHFDSSYDGLFAAAAGAAIGAMSVRRLAHGGVGHGGQEKKKLEILGGAIAGGLAFNAAENHYRVYTEERKERKQKLDNAQEGMETGMELAAGVVQEAGPQM